MKTAYKRLNLDHRIEIEKLIALGKNNIQIASALSVHPSTISRELKRVQIGSYTNLKAEMNFVHNLMDKRLGKTKIESNPKLKNFVYSHLKLHWSPQQISNALKQFYPFDPTMQISHESIYYHIYIQPKKEVEKLLISQLRQKRNYRGNVRRGTDKRTTIKDPIRIDERPAEVATREIPTNENTNGLIRDYFPKGADFNLLNKKDIIEVQNQLN